MRSLLLIWAFSLVACSGPHSSPAIDTGAADTGSAADAAADSATVDARVTPDLPDFRSDATTDRDASSDAGLPPGPWRSALYADDWTPSATDPEGRFLHDFSYAGYHNGPELPRVSGAEFDVADYGADPTASSDSRPAFQAAVDAASVAGGIVAVGPGEYRLDDIVSVAASNVVIRGAGADQTKLWFTRWAGMGSRSHIEFGGTITTAAEVPLASDGLSRATWVEVEDASAFGVGDDVSLGWTITDEFVDEHAMTGVWTTFNGTWQPFFRRQIVEVDATATPPRVRLDVPLRYVAKVRDGASLRKETGYLREVGVEGIGVADAVGWQDAWAQPQVHVIGFRGVADGWVANVASFPSPGAPAAGNGSGAHLQNGGIIVVASKRVTVADSSLELAQNRGGGGSGYLFEVRQSSEVLFRDLVGRAGRHNFIQNWGFGATGIVWLRVHSSEGRTFASIDAPISATGDSEFHHSLAMANLIDSSTFDDGFSALNRKAESTGAGHTSTETVFWNVAGTGRIRSYQYGNGYVIGTTDLRVFTGTPASFPPGHEEELEQLGPWTATWPEDWTEGLGRGGDLEPSSLYEDQLRRRLAR